MSLDAAPTGNTHCQALWMSFTCHHHDYMETTLIIVAYVVYISFILSLNSKEALLPLPFSTKSTALCEIATKTFELLTKEQHCEQWEQLSLIASPQYKEPQLELSPSISLMLITDEGGAEWTEIQHVNSNSNAVFPKPTVFKFSSFPRTPQSCEIISLTGCSNNILHYIFILCLQISSVFPLF